MNQEKLYKLIVNNRDLEKLESKINIFNPFNILKIEHYEIRHSNVLAWLINPHGNHNLNDFFLKKLLSQIILENENFDQINIMDEIQLANFKDSIVDREEANIDILLKSQVNKFILLIENKFHSSESPEQLTKYLKYIKEEFPEYKILPVLLTKTGDEPLYNDQYITFSYESIYSLISELIEIKENNLSKDIISFLKFYLLTLKNTLGMDEELKDLCLKIYNEHTEAIDMINAIIKNKKNSLKEVFNNFKNNHTDLSYYEISNNWMTFLPKDIEKQIPKMNTKWNSPYPVVFWFSNRMENHIKFVIEVGPLENKDKRLNFIMFLEKEGYRINKSAKRIESKYTRIFTDKIKVLDWDNQEETLNKLEEIYEKSTKEIQRLKLAITNYFKLAQFE